MFLKVARAIRGGSPEPRTRARRARFSVIHALTIHPELGDEAIAARIAAEARAGGQFVFTSLTRASVEYVLRRAGAPVEYASFPPGSAHHTGWQSDEPLLQDRTRLGLGQAFSV